MRSCSRNYVHQLEKKIDVTPSDGHTLQVTGHRTLIAVSVQKGLKRHQIDVNTAFLNGEPKEEVYTKQPEGYVIPGKEHLVCKLKKSIYGLKQSPCCWNTALHNHLKKMGFVQTATNPCGYRSSGREAVHQGVYMDDSIVAA